MNSSETNNTETTMIGAINRDSNLMEQINAVLTAGEWKTPEDPDITTSVSSLSDYGKALFTLRHAKSETLAQKRIELKELSPEEELISDSPFGGLFGGGAGIFGALGFGGKPGFGVRITTTSINLTDRLQSDSKRSILVQADIDLLESDIEALENLLSSEMQRCAEAGFMVGAHAIGLSPDFGIVRCGCAGKVEQETALVHSLLSRISNACHIIHLPKEHSLIADYKAIQQELLENNVVCLTGFIPDLQTDETVALYFPKDLSKQNLYGDVNGDVKDSPGAERKAKVQTLFNAILEAGKPYEAPTKEKAEEEGKIVVEADN